MITAIDDFGAGHNGLNMLADFVPDVVKIDMALTRDIHAKTAYAGPSSPRSCRSAGRLHISVIAEGVESMEEAVVLRRVRLGVRLFQGYLLAKPALERLPPIAPGLSERIRSSHEISLFERHEAALGRRA